MDIDKKGLKDLMTTHMDYDSDGVKLEIKSLKNWYKSLPNQMTLYRVIFADKFSDINFGEPGSHYALNKKQLMESHGWLEGYGENKYLLTVHSKKGLMDVKETLRNRILYPHENEITLQKKGKGSEIVSVQEIIGSGLSNNLYYKQ